MQRGSVPIIILIGILILAGVGARAYYLYKIKHVIAPPGCSWKQIQCIKTPCDPILVCSKMRSVAF